MSAGIALMRIPVTLVGFEAGGQQWHGRVDHGVDEEGAVVAERLVPGPADLRGALDEDTAEPE